jgi:protein PET100, fungi type
MISFGGCNKKLTIFVLPLQREYVVYPPEGPRPPSPEELRERAREIAQKRQQS